MVHVDKQSIYLDVHGLHYGKKLVQARGIKMQKMFLKTSSELDITKRDENWASTAVFKSWLYNKRIN